MSTNAWALTTRTRVMQFMNVSSLSSTEEIVLDRTIDSVTDFIEHYCGRRFKLTAYSNELYDGEGQDTIVLKNYPVSSTASFTFQYRNSTLNEDSWSSIDVTDYFIDYTAGLVQMGGNAKLMQFANKIYRVSYTAGYDFDNTTTFLSTVGCADLEYIAWRLVSTVFDKRKGEAGVEQESIGDYSVTYAKTVFENPEIKEVLDKYKRNDIGIFGISSAKDY